MSKSKPSSCTVITMATPTSTTPTKSNFRYKQEKPMLSISLCPGKSFTVDTLDKESTTRLNPSVNGSLTGSGSSEGKDVEAHESDAVSGLVIAENTQAVTQCEGTGKRSQQTLSAATKPPTLSPSPLHTNPSTPLKPATHIHQTPFSAISLRQFSQSCSEDDDRRAKEISIPVKAFPPEVRYKMHDLDLNYDGVLDLNDLSRSATLMRRQKRQLKQLWCVLVVMTVCIAALGVVVCGLASYVTGHIHRSLPYNNILIVGPTGDLMVGSTGTDQTGPLNLDMAVPSDLSQLTQLFITTPSGETLRSSVANVRVVEGQRVSVGTPTNTVLVMEKARNWVPVLRFSNERPIDFGNTTATANATKS
eukprot:comp12557_c0_seq1/m.7556 comp12557_c0_seq1/g.7556  ORF comp12557_c0_seq1/g.7556 comp12557_c0_seq1/m.7556 type:complete len:362 (-) comp12557_c0_seq1:764-1849(-)